MKSQKIHTPSEHVSCFQQELKDLSLVGNSIPRQKYLNLKGWKPCLSLFLATNYAFMSCVIASESPKADRENLTQRFIEKSRSQVPNPLSDETNHLMPRVIKTNIPTQYLKITENGIYLDDKLKSLEKDLFIEASGDIYLQRLKVLGNLTVLTTGKLSLLENASVEGVSTLRAGEVDVLKKLSSAGNLQLFAEKSLFVKGVVKSKATLQLVGVGEISITGRAEGEKGIILLSAGKINQNGAVISQKEVASQSKEFSLGGTLLSHEATQIKTQELLEAKPGSSIGAKGLSLASQSNNLLLQGDVFVEGRSYLNSPQEIDVSGHFKSTDRVALHAKNFSLPGILEALDGSSLSIDEEWKLPGIFIVKGSELQGKVKKFTLGGLLDTRGSLLTVESGSNTGTMLTRGHCNLNGGSFTHHKGSVVFTSGVHQVDFRKDYQDASQFYSPTLLIAKANHLMFQPGFESFLKDALLSSPQQITVYDGAKFNLFGPRTFLQLTSDGSANFKGKANQDSQAQYPFERFLEILKLKWSQIKASENASSPTPKVSELKEEVAAMALTHPWRALKKGHGISMVVGGDVKYAGVSVLDGGAITVNATRSVQSDYGSMQSGAFTGHNVGIHAASAILDNTVVKSYLDKVTVTTIDSVRLKDTQLSGGLQALVSSLDADIQRSRLESRKGDVFVEGTKQVQMKDTQSSSHKDTSVRGGQVGLSGLGVKSDAQTFVHAEGLLAVDNSEFDSKGNHFSGEDAKLRQLKMAGDSTVVVKHDLSLEDVQTAGHLATRSGNKTTFAGILEAQGLNSEAKTLENGARVQVSGAVELKAGRLDQNKEIIAESVFIQADEFKDKETSKAKAMKTLVLVNEKGTGFSGTLEGDTVVIKMDDFQLKALRQVIAKVTQLHINKDVVVNEDLLLNNTLHLWANSLIQKGKITALGDLIAQLKKEVELYDIMDIKGTGAIIAGGSLKVDHAQVTAEKLYLQSKTKDVTLFRAALKALSDIKISADEGNIKKTGSNLQAGENVGLRAAGNIESRSEVERIGSGNNFQEKKVADKIDAGGALSEDAGGHILFSAVENKAGGDISYKAGRHIIDTTVALETQYSQGADKNYDKGTRVTQGVSKHQAGGDFVSSAGGRQELYAPEIRASGIKIEAEEQVTVHEVRDTQYKQSQSESDGGFFGQERKRQEVSQSAQSKGAKFYGTKRLEIIGREGISLTNITSTAPKTSLTSIAGAVRILLGKNQTSASSNEKSSNILWNRQTSHVAEHSTYSSSTFGGALEITSKETFVESIKGQTLDFTKQLEAQGINVIHSYLEEVHKDESKTVQGPSKALAAVVVLAVSICTAGTGAAIGGAVASGMAATGTVATVITGMTAAAFTSLCSQAALALLSNEGNIVKAAESLASTSTLENLGLAMITAGVTAGVTDALNIPQSSTQATTMQQIERQAIQSTVGLTANLVTGQKPEDALLSAAKGVVAGVVSSVATRSIGEAYTKHDVDFIGHKFLHALVGGATGALLSDDPLNGAASGAFGAVTAEMIGELVLMNSHNVAMDVVNKLGENGTPITPERIKATLQEELKFKTDLVKLFTSGVALLSGQDVGIANFTACSAIDNNLSHMLSELTEREVYDVLQREGVILPMTLEVPLDASTSIESNTTIFGDNYANSEDFPIGSSSKDLPLFSLKDSQKFQMLQSSTLYKAEPGVSNPRNHLISVYETLQLLTPESYTGNLYPSLLLPSATLSNYSAAAECTVSDPINNRVRWYLQVQATKYGIEFGYDELNWRAANKAEFSYEIHEKAFQFANNVSTIRQFPWWVLHHVDVPAYGKILGEWLYKPTSLLAGVGSGLSELAYTQSFDRANIAFDSAYDEGMRRKENLGCRTINWLITNTNSPHGFDSLPWYGKALRLGFDGISDLTQPLYK